MEDKVTLSQEEAEKLGIGQRQDTRCSALETGEAKYVSGLGVLCTIDSCPYGFAGEECEKEYAPFESREGEHFCKSYGQTQRVTQELFIERHSPRYPVEPITGLPFPENRQPFPLGSMIDTEF